MNELDYYVECAKEYSEDMSDKYKNNLRKYIMRSQASNSFAMKGWHIGIISALIVFFFSKDTINYHALFIVIAAVTLNLLAFGFVLSNA